jgi:hypothetical protein
MTPLRQLVLLGLLAAILTSIPTDAFVPSKPQKAKPQKAKPLSLFRRERDAKEEGKINLLPSWFGRRSNVDDKSDEATAEVIETKRDTPTFVTTSPALLEAAKLKAAAGRARLEAERMDAELTLRKIARLEKELAVAAKDVDGTKNKQRVEELQREMLNLQSKMLAETQPAQARKSPGNGSGGSSSTIANQSNGKQVFAGELYRLAEPFSDEKLKGAIDSVSNAPNVVLKALAVHVEYDFETVSDINATEVAVRLDQMERFDFSNSSKQVPSFSKGEIDQRISELKNNEMVVVLDSRIKGAAGDNVTRLALLSLEYDYYFGSLKNDAIFGSEKFDKIIQDEEWLAPVLAALNKTDVDNVIETLYPKCTRKETHLPTLTQVQQLVSTVLPQVGFAVQAKPEAVAGGFVLRGKTRAENGNVLIDAIEKELTKTGLGEKMTVLFTNDFTALADEDRMEEVADDGLGTILYVTGPDICRDSRPVQLSIVSALGLATSWYLSIYPFLLNPTIAQRVDEQLALVSNNMTPDLGWLTELAVPLFVTFVGIQLAHELGHLVVGSAYKVRQETVNLGRISTERRSSQRNII